MVDLINSYNLVKFYARSVKFPARFRRVSLSERWRPKRGALVTEDKELRLNMNQSVPHAPLSMNMSHNQIKGSKGAIYFVKYNCY